MAETVHPGTVQADACNGRLSESCVAFSPLDGSTCSLAPLPFIEAGVGHGKGAPVALPTHSLVLCQLGF